MEFQDPVDEKAETARDRVRRLFIPVTRRHLFVELALVGALLLFLAGGLTYMTLRSPYTTDAAPTPSELQAAGIEFTSATSPQFYTDRPPVSEAAALERVFSAQEARVSAAGLPPLPRRAYQSAGARYGRVSLASKDIHDWRAWVVTVLYLPHAPSASDAPGREPEYDAVVAAIDAQSGLELASAIVTYYKGDRRE